MSASYLFPWLIAGNVVGYGTYRFERPRLVAMIQHEMK
jgi:hypothetical protein